MKFKQVLKKLVRAAGTARAAQKYTIIANCNCECHKGQPWISHFVPCCKYSGQQNKSVL